MDSNRLLKILLIASALLIPVWVFLTEPYVVEPSPLKLFEAIHSTYYVGLAALTLSVVILLVKTRRVSRSALNPYLVTALLLTLYMQLPLIALFEHPVSDHSYHLLSAFYMLREGTINMPNNPHPETVSPQLLASILVMITSLPSPLEDLNRISVFLLPLLTTLYVYIFMRRLGVEERFAMTATALNMALTSVSFVLLRQIYAMPLYIMLALLTFTALKERKVGFSILAIVTSIAFVMSDPAHVVLTIIPLALFAVAWFAVIAIGLTSKTGGERFRSLWIFATLLFVMFFFWIIHSFPYLSIHLWSIVKRMWDVFVESITEFTYPLPETPVYWGIPTALAFNDYYASLYRLSVILKAISIALPSALFAYMLSNRKTRPMFLRPESLFLTSYFFITAIVIVTRGYGFTYTPWAAMTTFYALDRLNNVKHPTSRVHRVPTLFALCLLLASIIVTPHIIYSGGRMRLPTTDICAIFWVGGHSSQIFMISPGVGSWLSDLAYASGGYHIRVSDYLFYEGLTPGSVDKLAQYEMVIVPKSALMHFEKTDCYIALEMLKLLAYKLSNNHNLVYDSGYPFVTVWLK
jgi:hypothetical protein